VQLERTALDAAASGEQCAVADGGGAMLAKELGVCISTVAVRHSCRDACGVIVENLSAPPWKIVYSGDTRPCQALEAAGAG
jgi:ribonuclease BN (tRNA processing enzyme)